MKRILFLLPILLTVLCSCGEDTPTTLTPTNFPTVQPPVHTSVPSHLNEITDQALNDALYNFNFEYDYLTPGAELTYNHLWEGKNVTGSERVYNTYEVEYHEFDSDIYLMYLKTDDINANLDWFTYYESKWSYNESAWHFTTASAHNIIDGKYLFSAQKSEKIEEYKCYQTSSLNDIPFRINDYQLVFAGQSKKAIINADLTKGETLNKEITLLKRYELIFDENFKNITEYECMYGERTNQNNVKAMFNFVGTKIETAKPGYEEKDYAYLPQLGMTTYTPVFSVEVKTDGETKVLELPRYETRKGEDVDLLDENTTFLNPNSDPYSTHKLEFFEAFLKNIDKVVASYKYAYFDYNLVKEIIKE